MQGHALYIYASLPCYKSTTSYRGPSRLLPALCGSLDDLSIRLYPFENYHLPRVYATRPTGVHAILLLNFTSKIVWDQIVFSRASVRLKKKTGVELSLRRVDRKDNRYCDDGKRTKTRRKTDMIWQATSSFVRHKVRSCTAPSLYLIPLSSSLCPWSQLEVRAHRVGNKAAIKHM